jgi:epoxyqueuosine reductase
VTPSRLAARARATGRRLGFDVVAVGPALPPEHGGALEAWLDAGYAGTMGYLERGRAKRLDPRRVLPGARSVIAVALDYYQGAEAPGPAHVSRYAWGDDYHGVMEPRLRALLDDLIAAAPGSAGRVYVDTGPVLERELAARAGLGWVGKNTMLLHPRLGSWFFVGVVLTTAELAPDVPLADRCGTCTRCLEACPTGAFVGPYVLDARRCISYLTIEHRGPIPVDLRGELGGHAFGCDVCQDVCPWNRKAPVTAEAAFAARRLPDLAELATLTEETYRTRLAGSPLRRARRRGLARNAAVALGNLGGAAGTDALRRARGDPDPEVREHAAWALERAAAGGAAMAIDPSRDALLVVDVQNDFCPGGALAVPEGDRVVPVLNAYVARFVAAGAPVLVSRDWHPPRTRHFQAYGGVWPPHCVQETRGADFHPALALPAGAVVFSKGMDPEQDAYSAFQGRDPAGRPLALVLADRGVRRLWVGGLATDYCVKATVLDATREGLEVLVLGDAIRAVEVAPGDGDRALAEMRAAGARVVSLEAVRPPPGRVLTLRVVHRPPGGGLRWPS